MISRLFYIESIYFPRKAGRGAMRYAAVLENMISRYGIRMEASRVASNPVLAPYRGTDGIEHYRCRLQRPGKKMNCYVTVDSGDEEVSLPDVLLMLVADASGCKMMESYYGRHQDLGGLLGGPDGDLTDFDEFWQEYKSRCHQIQKLRTFLGEALFGQLVSQFGFK
jgi:hypothetical protein